MNFLAALADDAPADAQPAGGSPFTLIFFMGALFLVWWLLVLRPQSKADKARRAKLEAIQKGDKVRTRGGIEGVVVRVQDDKVVVKIDLDGKVHVPFAKSHIEDVLTDEPPLASKESK